MHQLTTIEGHDAELPRAQRRSRAQPQSVEVSLRIYHLEGSAQAALATLRRALVEKVPPTRNGLAHEAAIAFDLEDHQQALAIVDRVAQTVGISAF
jgi:hypothetical protein